MTMQSLASYANPQGLEFDQTETVQSLPLGTLAVDTLGNTFRYVTNGEASSSLARGQIVMQEGAVSITGTVTSSTDKLTITKSSAFTTAGIYSGYYVYVNNGGAEGDIRLIKGNDISNLFLDRALSAALNSTSTLRLFNPAVVNIATGSAQTVPMGIAVSAIPAASYGWIQVGGIAEVKIGTAVATANKMVKVGDATAGEGNVVADGNDYFDVNVIGYSLVAGTNADKASPIRLIGLI